MRVTSQVTLRVIKHGNGGITARGVTDAQSTSRHRLHGPAAEAKRANLQVVALDLNRWTEYQVFHLKLSNI